MTRRKPTGFTIAELLVATVLLGFVLTGLHQAHLRQRRFTDWQRRVADTHDGYRIAHSILSTELREAVISEGDVDVFAPDSVAVRSPQGFGIVCDVRENPPLVALSLTMGDVTPQPGDSLLAFTDGGWRALAIESEERPDRSGLACPYGNPTPERAFRLPRGATDSITVGAPVRVFRPRRYHLVREGDATWMARTDAGGTEALVGPLTRDGLRFRLIDASGQEASRQQDAVAVELQLTMLRIGAAGGELRDTLSMLFQGRNR